VTGAVFDGTAGVATGSGPTTPLLAYRVRVREGRLCLADAAAPSGTVLDVTLDRVAVSSLGRAGVTRVEVDGSPLLVDFARPDAETRPATRTARWVRGLSGRWARRRFVSAVDRGRR
jgi:hypothetical protein